MRQTFPRSERRRADGRPVRFERGDEAKAAEGAIQSSFNPPAPTSPDRLQIRAR